MAPRIAKSLDVLRKQINEAYPGRSKKADGWIGDAAHSARQSEHNPDANGVVRALDITHDPAKGVYIRQITDALIASRDPRILYIIRDGQIARSYPRSGTKLWTFGPYGGSNPHTAHFHVSVVGDPKLYDKTALWSLPKLKDPAGKVFKNITATVFDDPKVAYPDVKQGYAQKPGCAVPYKYPPGPRPVFRVTNIDNGLFVDCPTVDVGPWNINDPWWVKGTRPQAESGTDMTGRKTNKAGIDLTPAAAKAIGLRGKGLVNVELVQ